MDVDELDQPAADAGVHGAIPTAGWDHLRAVDNRLRAHGVSAELRADVRRAISASWRVETFEQERHSWHAMTEVCRRVAAALARRRR